MGKRCSEANASKVTALSLQFVVEECGAPLGAIADTESDFAQIPKVIHTDEQRSWEGVRTGVAPLMCRPARSPAASTDLAAVV